MQAIAFKWLINLAVKQLEKLLENSGAFDTDCAERVVKWLQDGSLGQRLRDNPKETLACIAGSVAVLVLIGVGRLHDHEPDRPNIYSMPGAPDDQQIEVEEKPVEDLLTMADTLGVTVPKLGDGQLVSALNPIVWQIIAELAKRLIEELLKEQSEG